MQHFTTEEILRIHSNNCIAINGTLAVEMPKPNTSIQFNSMQKSIPCPFVIYADIEALLIPLDPEKKRPTNHIQLGK